MSLAALRDKTMDDKLIYNFNIQQNYSLCRLKLSESFDSTSLEPINKIQ